MSKKIVSLTCLIFICMGLFTVVYGADEDFPRICSPSISTATLNCITDVYITETFSDLK